MIPVVLLVVAFIILCVFTIFFGLLILEGWLYTRIEKAQRPFWEEESQWW